MNDFLPYKVFSFCPRCGSKHFAANSTKSCKCTDCGFIFYFNAATAVAVIIRNERNQILLTTRAFEPGKGMLDLPGGFVDPLETAETAVHREIAEELNLKITSMRYIKSLPNTYLYGGIVYYTTDLMFECTVENLQNLSVHDDVSACNFYTITPEIIENVSGTSIKNILREFLSAKSEFIDKKIDE